MINKIINNIPTSGEVFQRIEENVINSNSLSIILKDWVEKWMNNLAFR